MTITHLKLEVLFQSIF